MCDRGGGEAVCLFRSVRRLNEFVATLLQAEKTSFAASPVNPRAVSHSAKMDCHLLQARTVQLPILSSSLAILYVQHNNRVIIISKKIQN